MWTTEIKEELFSHIIPFWMNLRDEEFGGYYGYFGYDLDLDKKSDKGVILHSRILWFFSNVYAYLTENPSVKEEIDSAKYGYKSEDVLNAAKHAYKHLVSKCIDNDNGGVYWSVTFDGEPADTTKHTYNIAFTIYALSSYYAITNDKVALNLAYDLFTVIETKCRDEEGYLEAFDIEFKPAGNDKLSENGVEAGRTMNTLLHIYEAYSELYRVDKSASIADKLYKIIDIFVDNMFNTELNRQEVFFDLKYNTLIDLHSYGHDIETSWLFDRGLEILETNDPEGAAPFTAKLRPILVKLADCVLNKAFDGKALFNECEKGVDDTRRVWWVQSEAIVGYINAAKLNPKEADKYMKTAETIWEYTKNIIVDKRPGSCWYSEVFADDTPNTKKAIADEWTCPYHNGRMCLEVMKRLA